MLVISVALVFASATLAKTIGEKSKQQADLGDFSVNISTPIAVKDNELGVTGVENAFDKRRTLNYNSRGKFESRCERVTKDTERLKRT